MDERRTIAVPQSFSTPEMLDYAQRRILKTASALLLTGALALALAHAGRAAPAVSPSAARTPAASVDSIIELITHRNPGLISYQAHARLDIRQLNFPYLHPVLDGTEYYTSPGFTVFDFPHTPSYLKGITKVEGAVYEAHRWRRCYDITFRTEPEAYFLHMVPKIRGEVSALDVTVEKSSGDLQHFDWHYHNSGDGISLTQYYTIENGYSVVTLQHSDVTIHHIRARIVGTFDDFKYNVTVPLPTATPSDPAHQCDN